MKKRKFTWCRQEIAEFCISDVKHVHICITTPGYRGIIPRCKKKTLNFFFYDLDPDAIRRTPAFANDPLRGKEIIDGCFTEDHARQMIDFVGETDENGIVVVNCEAGISRSPAVVLAFRSKYGGDTEEVFREAYPNIHVASMLGRELGVGPFQAPRHEGLVFPFSDDKESIEQ